MFLLAGCGKSSDPAAIEVQGLTRQLRNGQLEERQAAAVALGKLKSPRAVDALVLSLGEPQPAVRQAAAVALGEIGDKRAVQGLARLLDDTNAESRKLALEALGKIGDAAAITAILARLDDDVFAVRYAVGPCLARLGPTALTPLLALVQDPSSDRRSAAVSALGHIRQPAAADALLAALDDPMLAVRLAAAEGLGVQGDTRAVDALGKLLKEPLREADRKALQEKLAAPISDAQAREIAKRLMIHEGQRRVPSEVLLQKLSRFEDDPQRPARPDSKRDQQLAVIEQETDKLRALVNPPVQTNEIAAIIIDRISNERWAALAPAQQELAIAKETDHLKTLWEEPATESKIRQLHQIIAARAGRQWWNGLTDNARQESIRKEYQRPIQDEHRNGGQEMRRAAANALAALNQPAALEHLFQSASAVPEISQAAQDALQNVPATAIPALATIARKADAPLHWRKQAMEMLIGFKDPQSVDVLLGVMDNGEPTLQAMAASALVKLNDPRAIAPLTQIMKTGNTGARRVAAQALGNTRSTEVVPALIQAAADPDDEVAEIAIRSLGRLGDPRAGDAVLSALQRAERDWESNLSLAIACVHTLGYIKEPRAVDTLIRVMDLPGAKTRDLTAAAASSLGRIGDKRAVEPLIAFLKKRVWGPCFSAAGALGELGDPRAIDVLVEHSSRRPYPEFPPIAIPALGKIKDPRAIKALADMVQDPDSDKRKLAGEALIQHGESAVPFLLPILGADKADDRGMAAQTLGYIGKPSVEPLLNALANPPRPDALPQAIYALSMIRDDRIAAALSQQAAHTDPAIRANIAWALGSFPGPVAQATLQKLAQDKEAAVRDSAASSLGRLRDSAEVK